MKYFKYIKIVLILFFINSYSQNFDKNFILKKVYLDTTGSSSINQINYLDNFGRDEQTITNNTGITNKDVISTFKYDSLGNQQKSFLPLYKSNTNLNYQENVLEDILNQYNAPEYDNTINPYVENILENKLQPRVLTSYKIGNSFKKGSNRGLKYKYEFNTLQDSIIKFEVSRTYDTNEKYYLNTIVNNNLYQNNTLFKNIRYDEENNIQIDFKDVDDNLILSRKILNNEKIDTYYVYDKIGNLCYVLPPNINLNNSLDEEVIKLHSYSYKYDYKNRLVEKKLPYNIIHKYVYHQNGKIAFSQEDNENINNWKFNSFDKFGRIVYSGFTNLDSNQTRISLQEYYNNNYVVENKLSPRERGVSYKGTNIKYSFNNLILNPLSQQSPTLKNTTILKIFNYYDNISTVLFESEENSLGVTYETEPFALLNKISDIRTLIIDNSNWISEEFYYDKEYKNIAAHRKHNGLTGTEILKEFKYDFRKNVTEDKITYTNSNGVNTTIENYYTYNNSNLLTKHDQAINGSNLTNIATNIYDDASRLVEENNLNNLIKNHYVYNINNNLLSRNIFNNNNLLYGFNLYYNNIKTNPNNNQVNIPKYNGNISYFEYFSSLDEETKGYKYSYDQLNRLTNAEYIRNDRNYSLGDYKESIQYDKIGNIKQLKRNGHLEDNQVIEIDDLDYEYENNQLKKVTDNTNNTNGFKAKNSLEKQFYYNKNGDLIKDENKNIASIQYNLLNLPNNVTFNNNAKIKNIYNGDGNIVRREIIDSLNTIKVIDYFDEFHFTNSNLDYIEYSKGYISILNNTFVYNYNVTDHLGNVRQIIKPSDESENEAYIVEENSYYPFGYRHQGINDRTNNSNFNKKFNNKEFISELGINWYDYGARNYDAALGRWMNVDPLADADKNIGYSPYAYAINNPITYIDPDGRCWQKAGDSYVPCDDASVGSTTTGAFGNSWTMTKNDGWQLTNGADPSTVNYEYDAIPASGNASYYEDRYKNHIEKYNTRPPDYYLGYGHKYINRFKNETRDNLTALGQEWLDETAVALQQMMNQGISANPSIQGNNDAFQGFAYGTHVPAYSGSGKIGLLKGNDLWNIMWTPDIKDSFLSKDGVKQIMGMFPHILRSPRNPDLWDPQKNPGLRRPGEF